MLQNNCDFSPLKKQISKGLEEISFELNKGIDTLKNDNYCLLDNLEDVKEKLEEVEAIAASFYLNCYFPLPDAPTCDINFGPMYIILRFLLLVLHVPC